MHLTVTLFDRKMAACFGNRRPKRSALLVANRNLGFEVEPDVGMSSIDDEEVAEPVFRNVRKSQTIATEEARRQIAKKVTIDL